VDTPFAWIDQESEESSAAAPPISAYFRRLLAWEPGTSEAGGREEDQGEGDGSSDGGDGFTTWMNEDGR
jgi:hypothetical protein